MSNPPTQFTVFTKPWPNLSLEELGKLVHGLRFDGVELPVRAGFQVEPANVTHGLREAVKILKDQGVHIGSIAGPTDEHTISACGENGIPIIRVCLNIDLSIGYMESEIRIRSGFDKLIPTLEKNGVAIGIQNHYGNQIASAIGIMHLIEDYDPRHVCAVLDPAHCALDGEGEEMAFDIVQSHLRLVNYKAASRRRLNRITAREAEWEVVWSTARNSQVSWRKMTALLQREGYRGDICLTAEYSDPDGTGDLTGDDVLPFLKYDIDYARELFAEDFGAEL